MSMCAQTYSSNYHIDCISALIDIFLIFCYFSKPLQASLQVSEEILVKQTLLKVKGNVLYGQEPPSGESTATECGVNY